MSKFLDYLRNFSDISEKTATRILANQMLLDRLVNVERESPEFQEAIEMVVAEDNERLLAEQAELKADVAAALQREQELSRRVAEQAALAKSAHRAATVRGYGLAGG